MSCGAKNTTFDEMSWKLALVALALLGKAASTLAIPPLYEPVILNIGLNCQWQLHCMSDQQRRTDSAPDCAHPASRDYSQAKSAPRITTSVARAGGK